MITEQIILDAGYKEFSVPQTWNCDKFWQKCITEGQIKRYFINIRGWYQLYKEQNT